MKVPAPSKDILEFFGLREKHRVQYVIVGGEAVIYHGHARLTGDVDVFYGRSSSNALRLWEVLAEFWGGKVPYVESVTDLQNASTVFRFGAPPNRIDLMGEVDGVSFAAAWRGRSTVRVVTHGGAALHLHYMGFREMIRNKRAAGRDKDRDDLRFLLQAKGARKAKGTRPPEEPRR